MIALKRKLNFFHKDAICLTKDQTKYIYKKVEQGNLINTETMRQEVEEERLAETKIDSKDDNPYKRVILNKVYKDEPNTTQMKIDQS